MKKWLSVIAIAVSLVASTHIARAQGSEETAPVVAAADSAGQPVWYDSWLEASNVARESKQQMLVAIQAEWCNWCRMMNDSTWTSPEFLQQAKNIVLVRIDGDLDTTTVAKFHVSRVPTTILVTDQGAEVDRFVGYFNARDFQEEFTRALEGTGTMWELERKQTETRGDPKVAFAIARELIERGEMPRAQEFLTRVKAADASGSLGIGDDALFVEAQIERDDKNWYKALEDLKKLIKDFPKSEWREDAELYIPWLYAKTGDKKEALKKYNEFLDNYGSSTETQWVKRQIAKLETPKDVPAENPSPTEGQ